MRTITNRLAIRLAPAQQKLADDLLTGMAAGNVCVFRASPGMGKTTILRWMQAKLGSPAGRACPRNHSARETQRASPRVSARQCGDAGPQQPRPFGERISKPLWRKQNCCMRTPWRAAPNRRRGAVLSPCYSVPGKPAKPGRRRALPFG